jgi:hypothetical protein
VTGVPGERDSRDLEDIDALITDRYLESILAAHARGAETGPLPAGDLPGWNIRLAAARLAADLPRLHPSFRFEEVLAGKLADAAARMGLPLAAGGEGSLGAVTRLPAMLPSSFDDDGGLVRGDARPTIGRPLLIGGALTSAALSIAGAAYFAWRIRHPQSSPMARAVRAVARTRLA